MRTWHVKPDTEDAANRLEAVAERLWSLGCLSVDLIEDGLLFTDDVFDLLAEFGDGEDGRVRARWMVIGEGLLEVREAL
jgi:hypothetical protein